MFLNQHRVVGQQENAGASSSLAAKTPLGKGGVMNAKHSTFKAANPRILALGDITNKTPLPKQRSSAAKPTQPRLGSVRPATRLAVFNDNAVASSEKKTPLQRAASSRKSTRVRTLPQQQQTLAQHAPVVVADPPAAPAIVDIEYAPIDPICPLPFDIAAPLDLASLTTVRMCDAFPVRDLGDISDFDTEPELMPASATRDASSDFDTRKPVSFCFRVLDSHDRPCFGHAPNPVDFGSDPLASLLNDSSDPFMF
ncbi:hypothetical protein HDU98_005083 [Podochytrium sp. JEL0797]|nr:hypothetical protein HDU98_005083 [Podochytrium sp. JEL0797]